MKIADLIARLEMLPPEMEVFVSNHYPIKGFDKATRFTVRVQRVHYKIQWAGARETATRQIAYAPEEISQYYSPKPNEVTTSSYPVAIVDIF